MRKRGLLSSALLLACTDPRPVPTAATSDARPDVAAAPAAASAEHPSGPCADAIADATKRKSSSWKMDRHALDANGDGTDECVLRACYGSNCDVMIYAREPTGVRFIGEMRASIVSSPRCVDEPPKGTFCRLEVGVHMIHGETQETFWKYTGDRYEKDGHGELLPGPPKGLR